MSADVFNEMGRSYAPFSHEGAYRIVIKDRKKIRIFFAQQIFPILRPSEVFNQEDPQYFLIHTDNGPSILIKMAQSQGTSDTIEYFVLLVPSEEPGLDRVDEPILPPIVVGDFSLDIDRKVIGAGIELIDFNWHKTDIQHTFLPYWNRNTEKYTVCYFMRHNRKSYRNIFDAVFFSTDDAKIAIVQPSRKGKKIVAASLDLHHGMIEDVVRTSFLTHGPRDQAYDTLDQIARRTDKA